MMKAKMHKLFVRFPTLGRLGYEFVRFIKRDGTKIFLSEIRCRGFCPKSILDVGANRGEWSRNAKSVFKEADFFLIEPQIEMKPFLDRFCADSAQNKWVLAGAGAELGELTLTIWDNFVGSSFLAEELNEIVPSLEQRKVPVTTIDHLIQQNEMQIPDLVKIDVQGFELEVLKGGKSCFGHTEAFILETSFFSFSAKQPLFHEVVNFMLARGYVVYDVLHLLRRPLDDALGQANICFVKQDGVLRRSHRWR
jgi:FkbM family methyltransferase